MGLFQVQRLLYRYLYQYETCFSHRIPSLKPLAFRFTLSSVTKIASIGVVLIGIAISLGFRDKGSLQRLAEW